MSFSVFIHTHTHTNTHSQYALGFGWQTKRQIQNGRLKKRLTINKNDYDLLNNTPYYYNFIAVYAMMMMMTCVCVCVSDGKIVTNDIHFFCWFFILSQHFVSIECAQHSFTLVMDVILLALAFYFLTIMKICIKYFICEWFNIHRMCMNIYPICRCINRVIVTIFFLIRFASNKMLMLMVLLRDFFFLTNNEHFLYIFYMQN